MRGPLSSAQRPLGGGQSVAQIVSSLVGVATSDLPGFHAYGGDTRWIGPNDTAIAGVVVSPATRMTPKMRRPLLRSMARILVGVASTLARVPESVYGGGLNPPARKGMWVRIPPRALEPALNLDEDTRAAARNRKWAYGG